MALNGFAKVVERGAVHGDVYSAMFTTKLHTESRIRESVPKDPLCRCGCTPHLAVLCDFYGLRFYDFYDSSYAAELD